MSPYKAIILDLNGVLLSYASSAFTGALKPRQIKNILDSPTWYAYECGQMSRKECYETVATEFEIDIDVWTQTLDQLTETVRPHSDFIDAIKGIKSAFPDIKVYGMSNISKPDYELLEPMISMWGILDGFQASGSAGVRKPDGASYMKFLETHKLDGESCIFVDDRVENVVAAAALGFKGVTFKDPKEVERTLYNLLGDPVKRGVEYMEKNAGKMVLELSMGGTQPDNFSQFIILELTGDK
jgi:FMN phosphatase YigB (HAD superfamily)